MTGGRFATYMITRGLARTQTFETDLLAMASAFVSAAANSITLIQIREPHLSAKQLFQVTLRAVEAADAAVTRVLVNDRFDIALSAGAAGVHLRGDSISCGELRKKVPAGFVIGVSTHSPDEAARARDNGANFAVFGPVFNSPGKGPGTGVEAFHEACRAAAPMPVLALGGVNEANVASVTKAPSGGVAAIRFFHDPAGLALARNIA